MNIDEYHNSQPFSHLMNSIGGFREGEIDGKPFLIYTFLSGEAAIDSGGDDLPPPLQPLFFLCPSLRLKAQKSKPDCFLLFNVSPHFPSVSKADQQVGSICKFPVVPLFWCNNKEPEYYGFRCGACKRSKLGTDYYFCVTCKKMFHKECVESPIKIKHPSYPLLSIQLYSPPQQFLKCICCQTSLENMVYHCPTNKLVIHPVCAMKPIPIFIDHPKRHPHPLTFFPKQACLPCNICGLIKEFIPTYVCVRCVFVVYQDCIYFPLVIRISRHHHRICFTSSLPSGKWSCGVCRKKVDNNYGAYSCNECNAYFVHSRCALRRDLWDGEDLEGVPEKLEIVVEPFEKIADGIILHFSHGHHLKLEINRVYDQEKFCQACILPIYKGHYYACMDNCEFILHEACANAPRKRHHALHARPLKLKVDGYNNNKGYFSCDACQGKSCGFVYEDPIKDWKYSLDLRCASVTEPFEYEGHEHPLFLTLRPEEENSAICQICQEDESYCRKLNCIECDYILCFKCATLPYEAKYKHDKHFLTFREAGKASDHSDWCEVCERKIADSLKRGFYSCDDCCTTLHIDCLLGEDPYMRPGKTIKVIGQLHILSNNTLSRPFCHGHKTRCPHKVVFKRRSMTYCSLYCSYRIR